jgi:hypothetical protein
MQSVGKLIMYIIPVVVLIILMLGYYGDEGGFEKLKNTVKGAEKYVPNISIGAAELSGESARVSGSHRGEITKLVDAIHRVRDSSKKDCFLNYGGFSELKKEGTTIQIGYENGNMTLIPLAGAGGQQIDTSLIFQIENVRPCVIGGTGVAQGFESKIVNGGSAATYYKAVSAVSIKEDDGGVTGFTENRINYGTGFKDFEGHAWLFTPDNHHICFFPTVDLWTDDDGLNDDVIEKFSRLTQC